jgi:hypothetical protein
MDGEIIASGFSFRPGRARGIAQMVLIPNSCRSVSNSVN